MSITDELRDYAEKNECKSYCKLLTDIADRIDAEHESACGEAYGNGVQSVALPDMTSYVKLPVDADGVPIRVGDKLDGYGMTIEVVEMRYGRSGWMSRWALISGDGDGYVDTFAFTHHHALTVEDVLREFALRVAGRECMTARPDVIAEYAAKLRLAGDAE